MHTIKEYGYIIKLLSKGNKIKGKEGLAEKTGISIWTLYNWKQKRCKPLTKKERQTTYGKVKNLGKYAKRKNITFPSLLKDNIQSKSWAYLIGAFWSDGSIEAKSTFSLSSIDREFVDNIQRKIKLVFQRNCKIKYLIRKPFFVKQKKFFPQPQYRIRFFSRNVADYLSQITGNKIKYTSTLKKMSKENKLYLITGLIDGDGDITNNRIYMGKGYKQLIRGNIRLSSSPKILKIWKRIIQDVGYNCISSEKYRIIIYGLKLYKKIYDIGLMNRKQKKLQKVLMGYIGNKQYSQWVAI